MIEGGFVFPFRWVKTQFERRPNLGLEKCRSLWIDEVDSNVGVLLGQPSGNGRYLIDLDIDDHDASKLAPHIFPETASFGRGNRIRHCLFLVDEALAHQRISLLGPDGDTGFLEIRGQGHQTISLPQFTLRLVRKFGGSPVDPQVMPLQLLLDKIRLFAALTILFKHWPPSGSRNDYALAVSGILTKSRLALADYLRL